MEVGVQIRRHDRKLSLIFEELEAKRPIAYYVDPVGNNNF